MPVSMGMEGAACDTLLQLTQALNMTQRRDQATVLSFCRSCSDTRAGRDYFDIPTAPEHPFIETFTVQGLAGDAVDTTDVRAYLILRDCGSLARNRVFKVDWEESGLGLEGRVSHTPGECITFGGQRSPAYWEVIIDRVGSIVISVEWEISRVDCEPFAQPLQPGDLTG